ncbi:hypothetical protein BDQ94DRAFT_146615 [Aspergillus welwitschiae]|uniref:Uncharacterized protein n=1 Tax=Aspergillus welwitschiae TaxID=1341132 RepID=A0A3F3PYC7_9EURO|nr:hypothetical protein BDQ94DRAFT_146615 [Aspergillus welwitschiae]RDH31762.1 hypothetical protein BDQ94DRAFT_146615 [Aspergillus welwitschiae]
MSVIFLPYTLPPTPDSSLPATPILPLPVAPFPSLKLPQPTSTPFLPSALRTRGGRKSPPFNLREILGTSHAMVLAVTLS